MRLATFGKASRTQRLLGAAAFAAGVHCFCPQPAQATLSDPCLTRCDVTPTSYYGYGTYPPYVQWWPYTYIQWDPSVWGSNASNVLLRFYFGTGTTVASSYHLCNIEHTPHYQWASTTNATFMTLDGSSNMD